MNRRIEVVLLAAHLLLHARVVVDGVARRDRRVVPAVVHQQLAAARLERAQIRVHGVDDGADLLVDDLQVAVEIERAADPSSRCCTRPGTIRRRCPAPAVRRDTPLQPRLAAGVLAREHHLARPRSSPARRRASSRRPAAPSGSSLHRPPCTAAWRRRTCTRAARSGGRPSRRRARRRRSSTARFTIVELRRRHRAAGSFSTGTATARSHACRCVW